MIPHEHPQWRVDRMVEGGLVQRRTMVFSVSRVLCVIPGRDLGFDFWNIWPSEPRLVAVGDSRDKRPPETEPNDVVPAVGGVPEAEGRAEEPRIEVPGTAANDTVTTAVGCPSRAIRRRAKVVVVPTVFRPFPHIAMNLVEPPRIGLE